MQNRFKLIAAMIVLSLAGFAIWKLRPSDPVVHVKVQVQDATVTASNEAAPEADVTNPPIPIQTPSTAAAVPAPFELTALKSALKRAAQFKAQPNHLSSDQVAEVAKCFGDTAEVSSFEELQKVLIPKNDTALFASENVHFQDNRGNQRRVRSVSDFSQAAGKHLKMQVFSVDRDGDPQPLEALSKEVAVASDVDELLKGVQVTRQELYLSHKTPELTAEEVMVDGQITQMNIHTRDGHFFACDNDPAQSSYACVCTKP